MCLNTGWVAIEKGCGRVVAAGRTGAPIADRSATMERLLKLPACTLVTTGRTGTDFLQSLLDSHPQVLTFNGSLFFQTFWANSVCVSSAAADLQRFMGREGLESVRVR